ncbi:hypothetical protein ATJ88_2740 [Isoptericola jiangsuensis]|uniref:LysM domain-containing protein n=1 Tax=Isoptericola jiangsuensis TaxID=548579 RepID=A0A2A9EZ43_9MICO|nr:LysM peptidoglycan-binding domain-containing protein [Isoptericola jiangsuensis]PFG44023.1 hypothetical protein ATJ88_2740 [Isoptericola jiangsuensis]
MTAPRPSRRTSSAAALLGLAGLAATTLTLVGVRLRSTLPAAVQDPRLVTVDGWVELVVLGLGAAVAGWMLAGTLVALLCALLVRGRRAGERVDAALGRWTPALVRRLARSAVGVGVGAGLALTPVAATAADAPPTPAPAVVLDLGWQPTATEDTPAPSYPGPGQPGTDGTTTAAPQGSAPAVTAAVDAPTTAPLPAADPSGTPSSEPGGPSAATSTAPTPGDRATAADPGPGSSPGSGAATTTEEHGGAAPDAGTAGPSPAGAGTQGPGPGPEQETTRRTTAPVEQADGTAGAPATTRDRRAAAPGDDAEVVVVRGDTLWDIAARHLPADATDGDVLRAMLRWHDANRDVVGDDPDVVLPGQVLRAP